MEGKAAKRNAKRELKTVLQNPENASISMKTTKTPSSSKAKIGEIVGIGTQKRRQALRMTPRRNEVLKQFLAEVEARPGVYGAIAGKAWMNELVKRFGKPKGRAGLVTDFDVKHWLSTPEFIGRYERMLLAGTARSSEAHPPLSKTNRNYFVSSSPLPLSSVGGPMDMERMEIKVDSSKVGNARYPDTSNKRFSTSEMSSIPTKKIKNQVAEDSDQETIPGSASLIQAVSYQRQWHQQNNLIHKNYIASAQMQLKVPSNGIFIKLPPTSTSPTLYFTPTAWTLVPGPVVVQPDSKFIVTRSRVCVPTLNSTAIINNNYENLDLDLSWTNTVQETYEDYFYTDQEEPYDSSMTNLLDESMESMWQQNGISGCCPYFNDDYGNLNLIGEMSSDQNNNSGFRKDAKNVVDHDHNYF